MSARRTYNTETASGKLQQQPQPQQQPQQYTTSSRYRNSDIGGTGSGFAGSAPKSMNKENESQNIMHDRRVIRGSTYSLRRSIENRLNVLNYQSNNKSKRSTNKGRIKNRKNDYKKKIEEKTTRPISGRLHAEIQTDPYLEEIYISKNETEFGTQTDPLLDRPSTPLFIPKSSGKSIATQIEDDDLFDFDHEIEPILEVLIGKTIENSLMEVLEEEELKLFQKYKSQFQQKRNIQLAKCQRLEEEERRKEIEKEKRIKQAEIQKRKEMKLKQRIDAQRIATEFLENIENAVFAELDKRGHFFDPVVKEIETIFMPKLLCNVESKINNTKISNMIIDDIITNFVENMINNSVQIIKERDEKQKEFEQHAKFQNELNKKFIEKRKQFTKSIKSQKNDFDFKQEIIQFLNIPISANNLNDEQEQELPTEIQQNVQYIDNLIQQFENEDQPLWEQITCMLDKIGGEMSDKINRIDQYLKEFSIKSHKKQLLDTFNIYKQDEENLKKAIADCLGIDTFDEELHNKLFELLKSEQKDQMEAINELVKDKQDIKQFIVEFIKRKEEERIELQEAEKANEAEENDEDS